MSDKTYCPNRNECSLHDSCTLHGSCKKREYVVTRSTEEWKSHKIRKRVFSAAAGLEKRLRRKYSQGHPVGGYRREDLIQSAWKKLLEGDPPRSLEIPLDDYLITRMDTERNRIRRKKEFHVPNNTTHINESLTAKDVSPNNVSDLSVHRRVRIESELELELDDLYNLVIARDPSLKPLFDTYLKFGKMTAKEQAELLDSTEDQVYRMRKKLETLILICKSAIDGDEE